jgi:hypothetical protein
MMEMSSRKYSSDRQSGGSPRDSPYSRSSHSPHVPSAEPSIRSLTRRKSDEGLLPPPLPRAQHSRNSDSVSSNQPGPTRRLCAKCGQPMQDKFVRAMGKKFHLDCFRCQVRVVDCKGNSRNAISQSPQSSSLSLIRRPEWNIRSVKQIIFDA